MIQFLFALAGLVAALKAWSNGMWCIGRRSNVAYVRFYPNPGLMLPWFGGRRLVWNRYDGFFTRAKGSNARPNFGKRMKG